MSMDGPSFDALSPLDALLWDRARQGGTHVSLAEAFADAYSDTAADQLTVWTVSTGDVDPAERLAEIARPSGAFVEAMGGTRLLWSPHPRGSYVVGIWP